MPVVGRIIRISGPLVVAEGMSGAQMYEMVEVGEDRLIGEVTRIVGDKAYVQVYESTSGLRPGEPVYGTGYPLSVELGPGLLTQIFDGIQRPLERIVEKSGSVFVKRGVKVNALPRDKKWLFKPSSEVKPGDKVKGGDMLGKVQETSLIEHTVMVPPNLHGKLVELMPEGEYTIEDTIATLEQDGRKIDLKMYHRWPARRPRPFKEKLEPAEPLITGMRILDTLFPMAKGGTGAIPGGFGTGKCVLPGTPVMLADGTILPIEKVYEKYSDKGVRIPAEPDESLIDISALNLRIITFDGERLREARVSHLYKGRSNSIVRITTKKGRRIEVTPAHRLIVLNAKGYFEEKPAALIKPGERLVIPRLIPIAGEPQPLHRFLPEDATVRDESSLEEFRVAAQRLRRRLGSLRKVAEKIGMNPASLSSVLKEKQHPRLSHYKSLFAVLGKEPPEPSRIGMARSRKDVSVPSHVDGRLAELLGLMVSEGQLTEREVRLFSSNKAVRRRFTELLKQLFDISPVQSDYKAVKAVSARSTFLVKILENIGIPLHGKTGNVCVPPAILRSPEEAVAGFLRGYYLGSGSFEENRVEITTTSKCLATGIAYLLSRLGILYSVKEEKLEERGRHRILITESEELKHFYDKLSLRELRGLGMPKIDRLAAYIEGLSSLGVEPADSIIIGGRAGSGKQAMLAGVLGYSMLESSSEALRHVAVDEVAGVEVVKGDFTVYDLTVPETHNFVGGGTPSILHNTVTLHSLAQWSAARVVIYIGCGERGNEMTEVLLRFPQYKDPWSGKPLMERTILIANTSNMPVAAREASIYVGVTMAEYYRDMGYDVLLVADSTSRWAEALREIAGRLEEMPAEEGYPSYLASRLAEFYERAGRAVIAGRPERIGSVTLVGAVSPPGGDFTEPVTSHTKRFIRVFWALDTALAYSRHYPAINWILSYSAYSDLVAKWWHENVDPSWKHYRDEAMRVLLREDELKEIVRLVGPESLSEQDKLILEAARIIKEGFLKQNAFDPVDAFTPPIKQFKLLKTILDFYYEARRLVSRGVPVREIRRNLDKEITELIKAKFTVPNDELSKLDEIYDTLVSKLRRLGGG